jgi:hypothetical protein
MGAPADGRPLPKMSDVAPHGGVGLPRGLLCPTPAPAGEGRAKPCCVRFLIVLAIWYHPPVGGYRLTNGDPMETRASAGLLMTNALDQGYNEGRLAFRRYFAKYGPNVEQNDPRMPANPHVGHYGVAWLGGFESELRRHVPFTPSTQGFRDLSGWLRLRLRPSG